MEQKLLSIYIGNDVTRICELVKKSNTSIIVNNATEVTTPSGALDDGYITDVPSIAEAVRGCVFGRGFSAKNVIFTISSKKIASKEIVIPYVKGDKKISQILQANAAEYFPMSATNDFIFAHTVMENFQDDEGKKTRLTAVAAPRDMVESYYELADELRLSVESIDYVGNSVLQLLSLQMKEGTTELVLQIEKEATFVNIMSGKDVILQRSVPYGKNAVINSMMEIKKLSEKEAKVLLSNRKMIEEQVTEEEYAEAVRYLVSSIGRIVEYHRSRNPERIIDGIKVFGEGSAIEGIDEVLQAELGAEVSHFEQLNGVRVSGKAYLTAETALHYLANFGAVLNPIGLTLTQSKSMESTGKLINVILFVILGIAVVVMGTITTLKLLKYFGLRAEEKYIEEDIASMEDIEQIAQRYEETVAAYKTIKNFADGTVSDEEMVLQFILDLEKVLPSDARIDDFVSEDGVVTFDVTGTTKDEVADLIVQLKKLDYIDEILLTEIKDDDAPFTLGILAPEEDENDTTNEDGENENVSAGPEVIFPIAVQLRNRKGTEISDEVAAAIAGTGVSVTPDPDEPNDQTGTVEEEVLP
ncbi:MAG: pilus assembly protein PilM [Lachnospiraceae bacterium]|nr:pilus assembly protein PilM [Lachnospiraceae bacterium]